MTGGDALFEVVYKELHTLARVAMSRERTDHTLQPTALINEAYLRLMSGKPKEWESRTHFFGAAARAMRQVLIEHARSHGRAKRRGMKEELLDVHAGPEIDLDEVIAIDDSLRELEQLDERAARVVELRFFAGMSVEETAEAMDISPKTVKRDWQFAKVWIEQRIKARGEEK